MGYPGVYFCLTVRGGDGAVHFIRCSMDYSSIPWFGNLLVLRGLGCLDIIEGIDS